MSNDILISNDSETYKSAENNSESPPSLIEWKDIWKPLSVISGVFLVFFWLPIENSRFSSAVIESLALAKWYAQEHVLLCLVPAFFIAGAIAVFVSQAAVMKYLGAGANKVLSYGVASVSGSILAVCSCTVLPLFAGIWKMGAGLGPAIAFLYSGPAINVLAIILTARVLGLEIGIGAGRRGRRLQHRHRADHALDVPKGRTGQGRGGPAHARTGGRTAAVAERPLFRRHGGHSGVRQLG